MLLIFCYVHLYSLLYFLRSTYCDVMQYLSYFLFCPPIQSVVFFALHILWYHIQYLSFSRLFTLLGEHHHHSFPELSCLPKLRLCPHEPIAPILPLPQVSGNL